jgi:arginyl-tRNA synthetase
VKVDAAAWFRRMEDFEPEALANWKVWRELSIKKYEGEYDRLNVKFDEYIGESSVLQKTMDKALDQLNEMGLIEESNGAKLINLEEYKLGKAVVRKRGLFDGFYRWLWCSHSS